MKKIFIILLFPIVSIAQQLQYQNHEMEYDDLNRLTKVFFSNGMVHEYTYDNLGNRTGCLVYEAPKTYVPDDAFEQHLIDEGYDTVMDDYVYTHRIDDIDYLFMNDLGIADLTGIQDFEALETLHCSDNSLTTIDVTNNTNLSQLYCSHNNLTILDITTLSDLFILECSYNDISTLDLSNNLLLEHIGIGSTLIESLDLSNQSNITWFEAINGQLESLNLENGNNNVITYMNTANNPNLFCIQVDDGDDANNGVGIYASWQTDAQVQYSYNCNLTYVPDDAFEQHLIDLGYDAVLNDYVVTAEINNITFLSATGLGIQDVTGIEDFISIETLYFNSNNIETIDLSQNTQLEILQVSENNLNSINVSNNILLESLSVGDNQLTDLDISNNPSLFFLSCDNNQLTELNINNNVNLGLLNAHYNNISSLDVSQNNSLSYIWIRNNPIEVLDLSNNPNLEELNARNCEALVLLNLKNNNNGILSAVQLQNSPNLYCVQVDDEDAANNGIGVYGNWNYESQVEFSEDCASYFNIDYLVQATSLTCINSHDGKIEVSTENESFVYDVFIESTENNYNSYLNLNNDNNWHLVLENLNSGEYIIRITIEGLPSSIYEKIYILNILEVQPFDPSIEGDSLGRMVATNGGTAPYTVKVNGQITLITNETNFSFHANHGDLVEITTAVPCEGKFQYLINDVDNIIMYPNPTDAKLTFSLAQSFGPNIDKVFIQIFDLNGRLVKSKHYNIQNNSIVISIEELATGTYFAKLTELSEKTFKIIKE